MQIPATDDFTVTWPDPAMANAPWVADRMHFPGPTVQLAQELVRRFQGEVLQARTVFANGYQFSTPLIPPDPPAEVVQRGLAIWHEEFSPRIRAFCERIRSKDYDAMTTDQIARELGSLSDDYVEHMRLTMIVAKKFMEPTFEMLGFLEQELGPDGPMLAGALLQGQQNATAASGAGLETLLGMATRSPQLAEALKSGNYDAIGAAPGGAEFNAEFERFLNDFGWRAESWGSVHVPTWAENPSGALELVGRYLADPEKGPGALSMRSTEGRAAVLAEVESRLAGDKLAAFRKMLEDTSEHVAVSEDRARWQLSLVGVVRVPALALGRKLVAAGVLDTADDVVYLTWEEARRAGREPGPWVREAATRGKADFTRWEQLTPPPFLGAALDLTMLPPEMLPRLKHFLGLGAEMSTDRSVVKGFGASRGTVTGRARVIRHLDESDRLEPGDIMVCVTTAPPWTALFAIAAAVVTDTGGVVSHSAICAREFAIPCVVGTMMGTQAIPDGATVTVDGEAGTVTIAG